MYDILLVWIFISLTKTVLLNQNSSIHNISLFDSLLTGIQNYIKKNWQLLVLYIWLILSKCWCMQWHWNNFTHCKIFYQIYSSSTVQLKFFLISPIKKVPVYSKTVFKKTLCIKFLFSFSVLCTFAHTVILRFWHRPGSEIILGLSTGDDVPEVVAVVDPQL